MLALLAPALALAGPDVYGLGDGHDGPLVVSAPGTVVNEATALAADATAGALTVTVADSAGLASGRLVLLHRTADPLVGAVPDTATSLDVSTSDVGRYELARLTAVAGTTLTLDAPLASAFPASGSQLVAVPEYSVASVLAGGTIVAPAWDGASGGVVALLVQGTLTVSGAIRADGAGFRGGVGVQNTGTDSDCVGLTLAQPDAGMRGEGLALAWGPAESGQGNLANGGGGGLCRHAGGGGGGNGGPGGNGGWEYNQAGSVSGGYGGAALVHADVDLRLLLGGGGGSPEGDYGTWDGGPGGGVVWARARSILGTGTFSAVGAAAEPTGFDGGGGGGAGGTLVLYSTGVAACGALDADGGNGASSTGTYYVGPGGGGGGGRVYVTASSACAVSVAAGLAGTQPDPGTPHWGALPASTTDPAYVGVSLLELDVRAERPALGHDGRRGVVRHRDVARDAGRRRVGRRGAPGVPRRG